MDEFLRILEAFHWIRPWWLAAVPVFALIWWQIRRRDRTREVANTLQLPDHLLQALTVSHGRTRRFKPVDLVMPTFMIAALVAAGPTWQRIPNPFVSEQAPLIAAIELTDSMLANDVQPTRLQRAQLKLLDLMQLRAGGRTALLAFAGSAHLVLPPSEDPQIVKPFLEGLEPDIMPRPGVNGTAAVRLAHELLTREDTPGSILLMTDGLDSADLSALNEYTARPDAAGIVILAFGTEAGGVARRADGSFATDSRGSRVSTGVDPDHFDRLGNITGVDLIRATGDNGDLQRIQRRVASNLESALDEESDTTWEDQGWLLTWPMALMMVLWFRRGWTMQWTALFAISLLTLTGPHAGAEPIDWFLTPDQQGRMAFDNRHFEQAADTFEDPMWKGTAAYRAGRYEDAIEAFSRVPSAEGFFNLGLSYIKAREYALGAEALRLAVAEDPQFPEAQRNLEIAEYIIQYLNDLRLATDTGDESELSADGFKFDNTIDEGKEIVINDTSRLEANSEEQWMRAVDTESSEFLRIKFAVEADQQARP